MEAQQQNASNETARNAAASLISNVGLKVEALIGDAEITVAELSELKDGAVLPLNSSLSDTIELRLNGVVIAKGELVAVGDKFGIKITKTS